MRKLGWKGEEDRESSTTTNPENGWWMRSTFCFAPSTRFQRCELPRFNGDEICDPLIGNVVTFNIEKGAEMESLLVCWPSPHHWPPREMIDAVIVR